MPPAYQQYLRRGQADYVVMGRAAVADTQLVRKLKEGRPEDVRPCLRCNYCMDHGRRNPLSLELRMAEETTFDRRCSVNPLYAQGNYALHQQSLLEYSHPFSSQFQQQTHYGQKA